MKFSIKQKLLFSFILIIVLMCVMAISTYLLNKEISDDLHSLNYIERPISLSVEKVISYDSILTEKVYASLLHADSGEFEEVEEHFEEYNDAGIKLDNLLKVESKNLIDKSERSDKSKENVNKILEKLDEYNLKLVDLELRAFDEMRKGNIQEASDLVNTEKYHTYKIELARLYNEWANEEKKIDLSYEEKIQSNSFLVSVINILFSSLAIIVGIIVSVWTSVSILRNLNKLYSATLEIEKGNFKTRVDIKSGDELEKFADSFNKTVEALDKLDSERKEIDKTKTEFLSITSHELRSPMTPMKAQLQMLLEDYFGKLTDEQKDSLKIILNNANRLDKILLDFLEISRIEAARLKFTFVKSNLKEVVDNIVEEMSSFMPEKNIKIVNKVSDLPIIEVDPDRVGQVLRNLLSNSIKFSSNNQIVEVGGRLEDDKIVFYVKDNGVGISSSAQLRLFEPFYQVDNMYQHKSGGTGLGLAISKGIVESQGGRIWIESVEGKGATFFFSVPLQPVKEIKPIRLLFSNVSSRDEKIKKLFKEYLGPVGESEFEQLHKSKLIGTNSINEYLLLLNRKNILSLSKLEEFRMDLMEVISPKSSKIDTKEFSKFINNKKV
jgi:signal transduction histidine kinase